MTSSTVQMQARSIVRDLNLPDRFLDAVVGLLVDNSVDNVFDQVAIISSVGGFDEKR